MRHSFAALAALVVLAGCSTMFHKSYQEITVDTPGVSGVDCILETQKNKYHVVTPAAITVERSHYNMKVTCEKAYYKNTTIDKVRPLLIPIVSVFNVANGVVPGTAYDAATGSMWHYPDPLLIDMEPDLEAIAERQKSMSKPVPVAKKKEIWNDDPAPVTEVTPKGDTAFDSGLHK